MKNIYAVKCVRIVARSPKYEALPTILSRRYSKSFLAGKNIPLDSSIAPLQNMLLFKIFGPRRGSKANSFACFVSGLENRGFLQGLPNVLKTSFRFDSFTNLSRSAPSSSPMLSKRADFDTGGVKFCCTAVPFSTLATSLLLAVSADISSESENSSRSITS